MGGIAAVQVTMTISKREVVFSARYPILPGETRA